MTMVTVGPLQYEHVPAVRLLFARLVAERGEAFPTIDLEELDRFALMMLERVDGAHPFAACLVATTDAGGVLGFTAIQVTERQVGKPRRFAFMEWIGVTAPARKLGVGRALVEAAVQWCEAQGVGHIEGHVTPGTGWAAGATTYASRQVITLAECRASVLVPKAERPPVGATLAPEEPVVPVKRKRGRPRKDKSKLNGAAQPEESLP